MFDTSKDVLYIVISFCIIWVTAFLCWVFYYLAKVLKTAGQVAEEFRVRLQSLSMAVDHIRGKIENMSSILTVATSGVGGFMKKMAVKKAEDWINKGSDQANKVAKEAVQKAMKNTAKNLKKMTNKIKSK